MPAAMPRTIVTVVLLLGFVGAASASAESPGDRLKGNWLRGAGATGDWFGIRPALSDRGFTPYAVWTGEIFGNMSGGLERGTDIEALLEFGAHIDLEKATGWHGAEIHLSGLWIQSGRDLSADYVGNFDEVSNIAGRDTLRLYDAYLELAFAGGEFEVKLGQLTLDSDFMLSANSSLFLNASFGVLAIESANTPAPIYPIAALGGFARWAATEGLSFQVGVYDGDGGTEKTNRNGVDYRFGKAEGVALFAEAAIDTALLGRDGTYKFGGYYHSGRFVDFENGDAEWGNYGLYVVLDQVLVGTRDSSRLAAFFRAGISPLDDRSAVDWYLDTGFTARGFFADHRVGLGFLHSHF